MGKRRLVTWEGSANQRALIYRDPEWNEYVVKLPGKPEADYFTDDFEDARATARAMVKRNFGRVEVTKRFVRTRQRPISSCARGSFRTVKRGAHRIVVCCPKGKWNRRGRYCRVGMRAQSVLKRRKGR